MLTPTTGRTRQFAITRRSLLRRSLGAGKTGLLLVGCSNISSLARSSAPTTAVNSSAPKPAGRCGSVSPPTSSPLERRTDSQELTSTF